MENIFSRKRKNSNELDQADKFHGHGEVEENVNVQATSGKEERSIKRGSDHASDGAAAYGGNALNVGGDVVGNMIGRDYIKIYYGNEKPDETNNRNVKNIALKKFKNLKEFLIQVANENSILHDTTLSQKSGRCPGYAPLQMAQYQPKDKPDEHGHLHTREEIIDSYNDSSLDYLQPEEIFETAKKFIRREFINKKIALSEEAKQKCLSKLANVIGVIGQPGVGKSTLSKILLSRIASKARLYDVDYIFHINLRDFYDKTEMNLFQFLIGQEVCSSLDWMNDEEIRNEVLKLLVESKSVCILLDGLDEISVIISDPKNFKVNINLQNSPQNFILGLLSGKIFPEAKKIFTSRPGQMLCLSDGFRPKFLVQILGINAKGITKMCKNLCDDKSPKVLDHVKSLPDLYSYITIPIHCVLVINCIYEIITNRVANALPNSITDVFILSYFDFAKTEHMREDLNQFDIKNISDLKKICFLAWSGIEKRQFYFGDDDLKDFSLNQESINSFTVTFVPRNQKWSKASYIHRATSKCTYFTHLLIQEFFAAIHCLFFMNEEIFRDTFSSVPGPSGGILSNHYLMVVKFMFGLSNAETFELFQSIYPDILEPKTKQKLLKQYACASMSKTFNLLDLSQHEHLFLCSLAYELRNESFAYKIAKLIPNLMVIANDFLPADVLSFCYVLKYRNKTLNLSMRCNFIENATELFIKEMKSLLKPSNHIKFDILDLTFPSEFYNDARDELLLMRKNSQIDNIILNRRLI